MKESYTIPIPKIIHQSWKTTDLSTYADSKTGVLSQYRWKSYYPEYKYKLWTDADITNFIVSYKHGKYKNTFNRLDTNIKKIYFFRYLILYEYGGIYSDLDFIINKRLPDKYLNTYDFIGYRAPRGHLNVSNQCIHTINRGKNTAWVLGQAFFITKPKHPGIKLLIDNICEDMSHIKIDRDVLNHTGPEKINKIFVEHNLLFSDKTLILDATEVSNNKGKYGYHLRKHQW